ncbi:hypothetical protein [Parafrankia sp. BMG5.11]|uniref:hypothetical protein n=1 Tax=Parafrankia sp. BMG5.11 TaxID=222540 RepID=UPI00104036D7|nr:hypothetical protein [Parafrankia sp. BMG5.11]TCJ39200.1 hypothetical protein E0504_08605 [Parafrankia sp. BMG5.11]
MTRALVQTGDDDADNANLPVVLGLSSGMATAEVVAHLVDLLRSDFPLQPLIRDILADALSGEHETLRLKLSRKKTGPSPKRLPIVGAFDRFFRDLAIGKFIAEHPQMSVKVENAVDAALDEFNIVRSEAYQGLRKWRELEAAVQSANSDGNS